MVDEMLDANKYGKVTGERIKLYESEIGLKLPETYLNFLLKYNGGRPRKTKFSFGENVSSIHGDFYGIHEGPKYLRLQENYKIYKGRVPRSCIPIASDPFGNQICINSKGQIHFWDHELEGSDNSLKLIANDFDGFLLSLYEVDSSCAKNIFEAVKKDDTIEITKLINTGIDIEARDENGDTLLEIAAIHNSLNAINLLYESGAKIGSSLEYALRNAEFFEENRKAVELLRKLYGV